MTQDRTDTLVRTGWALLITIPLASCAGPSSSDTTPAAITDRSAKLSARIDAVARTDEFIQSGALEPGAAREALKRVVWERSAPTELRAAAVEQLLTDEPNMPDTRRLFALMLPTEPDAQIVALMGRQGAARGWTELAPPIVRRWARSAALRDNKVGKNDPERRALAELLPGRDPADTVFDVFLGRLNADGDAMRDRDRAEAWGLLMALEPDERRLMDQLTSQAVPDDALTASVVWSANHLRTVPRTSEQLAWVRRLQDAPNADFRAHTADIVSRLSPEQMRGWSLGHLAGALYTAREHPDRLARTRDDLLALAAERLSGRTVYRRDEASSFKGETLRDNADALSWGDAIMLHAALDATDDAALAGAFFTAAERDRRDQTTEFGGVIDAITGRGLVSTVYPPRPTERMGDDRFIASEEMLKAADRSMLFFHFHADEYTNRRFAGPSQGDLDLVRRQGRCSLVLTFISTSMLDADFYTPAGAVVDLGAIARPDAGG